MRPTQVQLVDACPHQLYTVYGLHGLRPLQLIPKATGKPRQDFTPPEWDGGSGALVEWAELLGRFLGRLSVYVVDDHASPLP